MKLPHLMNITLDDIAHGFDNDQFTSVHLVKAYIARINEVNDEFHAVLEVNKDALKIAQELDDERKQSGRRGPLHGVPILLKDNIDTHDSMNASAGSIALLGARGPREATVATNLRKAGAILLGKTNMSEWADWRCELFINGWSPRGGQTWGVYHPGMDPEGSSAGSGVASALGLAFASVGTETDGSIVNPADKNNIVGIKTTVALVARDGVIPISEPQDSVGPKARTVKDAAHMLSAMAGKSAYDKRTSTIPFDLVPDYAQACQSTSLAGMRIGIPRNSFDDVDPAVMEAFENAIKILTGAGATMVDNTNYACMEEWKTVVETDEFWSICEADFKEAIELTCQSLVNNPNNIRTLNDIIDFTKTCPEEDYPNHDIQRWYNCKQAASLPAQELRKRRERSLRCSKEEGILGALKTWTLDALIAPSFATASTTFAARAGLPVVAVPLGMYPRNTPVTKNKRGELIETAPNIPFCLTICGKEYSEETLIRVAYAFEQLTQVRDTIHPIRVPKTELRDVM